MNTAIIKPEWSFITIVLMVLGFIIFWPIGLAMLAYILWGERFGGSAEKAEAWVKSKKAWGRNCHQHYRGHRRSSGNAAFDDYREEQLKRLDEERQRLDAEVSEFQDYMQNLHKARDREEFDSFIRGRKEERREKKKDRKEDRDE